MRFATLALVAGIALALARPSATNGYELIGAVWPDEAMPVPYCVNVNDIPVGTWGDPILSPDDFSALVQAAFQKWQDIPETYISFSYQGFCDNDPWDNHDGVNTVAFGWLWGGAGGLDAPNATHGDILRNETFGQLYESDIIIDSRYAQSFEDPTEYINVILPHILVHEAGHFLGLDHSNVRCSVMAPSGVRPEGFCQDDIDGVHALYPRY